MYGWLHVWMFGLGQARIDGTTDRSNKLASYHNNNNNRNSNGLRYNYGMYYYSLHKIPE